MSLIRHLKDVLAPNYLKNLDGLVEELQYSLDQDVPEYKGMFFLNLPFPMSFVHVREW